MSQSARRWVLAESTYADVRQADVEVVVLPLGATEPHNLHLPYGTDTLQCDLVGEKICAAAHARGARVMLLPTMPYGTETNQREFPLSMNVNPSTLYAVVTDLVESLVHQGIRKIVLLNGHGGNEMKPLLRELHGKTAAQLFLCNWYTAADDIYHEIFEHAEDHAGEMETSLGLAYFSELVARNDDGRLAADAGEIAPTRFDAVNRGWVSITRPWHLLTTNSGSGNPHQADAAKGKRLVEVLVERLSGFLVELSEADIDERFPF
jgi:creatinine amidohydrolase